MSSLAGLPGREKQRIARKSRIPGKEGPGRAKREEIEAAEPEAPGEPAAAGLEEDGAPSTRAFPVLLWLGAIPLGLVAALAIFLFIGWLQPSLGGSERLDLPDIVQFRAARPEPPPPPPPREQRSEEKEEKVRKRPERPRSTPRSDIDVRPQLVSGLNTIGNLVPGGVGISLDLETNVSIDNSGVQDKDVIERARRHQRRQQARELSYRGMSAFGGGALSRFTKPRLLDHVKPGYPPDARKEGIEGFVLVKVLVSMVGAIDEMEILDAQPEGLFEQSVRDAVSRWMFAPAKDEAGNPVEFWSTFKLEFKLEDAA